MSMGFEMVEEGGEERTVNRDCATPDGKLLLSCNENA